MPIADVLSKLIKATSIAATLLLTPTLAEAQQTVRIGQGVSVLEFPAAMVGAPLNTFLPSRG